MNTTHFIDTLGGIFDMPKTMTMSPEKRKMWENSTRFLIKEVLLSQASEFKGKVMELAREQIGEFVTEKDVIDIISDGIDENKLLGAWANAQSEVPSWSLALSEEPKAPEKGESVRRGKRKPQSVTTPVYQYSKEGKFIREYPTAVEASEVVGVHPVAIAAAAAGVSYTSAGYVWRYADGDKSDITVNLPECCLDKSIEQRTLDGKYITTFPSIAAAAASVGASTYSIRRAIQGKTQSSAGYLWKLADDERPVRPCVIKTCRYPIRVDQYSPKGELIKHYNSLSQASRALKCTAQAIKQHIDSGKLYRGSIWKSSEN